MTSPAASYRGAQIPSWGPGSDLVPVDALKSDTVDLATPGKAFVVEVSGIVKVTTVAGEDRTIPAALVIAGQIIPLMVKRVWSTTTTATGIWVYT